MAKKKSAAKKPAGGAPATSAATAKKKNKTTATKKTAKKSLGEALATSGAKTKKTKKTKKTTSNKNTSKKTSSKKTAKANIPAAYRVGKVKEVTGSAIDEATKAGFETSAISPIERIEQSRIETGPQAEARERQSKLATALEAQMRGEGPSLAGLQLRQGVDEAIAAQRSMAATSGSPLAARAAAYGVGALGQQAALQSAQLRMAEALAAQQQLGGVLQQQRVSDIGLATDQAKLGQEASLANQLAFNQRARDQAQLNQNIELANAEAINKRAAQQAALNQQASLANQQASLTAGISQAEIMAGIDRARSAAGAQVGAANAMAGASRYATDVGLQKFYEELGFLEDKYYQGESEQDIDAEYGNVTGNAATDKQEGGERAKDIAAISDRRSKENIRAGDAKMKQFLDKLDAYEFDYKKGERDQVGVMAQDLEKTKVGKKMVRDSGGAKKVDFAKGFATILAAQAALNKRLNKLEKRNG